MRSRRTRCGNGIAGFGATPAEALRDLAQKIESYRFELPEVEGDQRRPQLKIVNDPCVKTIGNRCRGVEEAAYGKYAGVSIEVDGV